MCLHQCPGKLGSSHAWGQHRCPGGLFSSRQWAKTSAPGGLTTVLAHGVPTKGSTMALHCRNNGAMESSPDNPLIAGEERFHFCYSEHKENFVSTASMVTVRILLAWAIHNLTRRAQGDFKAAYLSGEDLEEKVYTWRIKGIKKYFRERPETAQKYNREENNRQLCFRRKIKALSALSRWLLIVPCVDTPPPEPLLSRTSTTCLLSPPMMGKSVPLRKD